MTAIIDAHHHIWRRRDLAWLDGPMRPRIFGPYEPIRRDYPIGEYLADIAGCEVTHSVYVQANWTKASFEEEVAYVQQASDESGYPHAIVGYADFLADDVRPQLDRLVKYRGMRGLRMQLHWHNNPQYSFAAKPDLACDPAVKRNVARLADYGWTFELQVFASQMPGAATLAASCPNVTFILQHVGSGAMASGNAPSRRMSERGLQALRPRHVHSPQRRRAYRDHRERYAGHIRPESLFVRIEFPNRENVDAVQRPRRGVPTGARAPGRRCGARRAPRHGSPDLSAQLTGICDPGRGGRHGA
jgi:predicted TIM-barrel fold metal-dependent hydrolase